MILDSSLAFDGPAFGAITTTRNSLNTLDMGVARDMGIGAPDLSLLIISNRLFAGGTGITILFQGSEQELTGFVTYAQTPNITPANLNAAPGLLFPIKLPMPVHGAVPRPRYYMLNYFVTGTFTAGAVQAYLVLSRDELIYYPSGFTTVGI